MCSLQVWRIFEEVMGVDRVVRVAAVWTSQQGYTTEFLQAIASYGATFTPPVSADIVAGTTYFGHDVQVRCDWV